MILVAVGRNPRAFGERDSRGVVRPADRRLVGVLLDASPECGADAVAAHGRCDAEPEASALNATEADHAAAVLGHPATGCITDPQDGGFALDPQRQELPDEREYQRRVLGLERPDHAAVLPVDGRHVRIAVARSDAHRESLIEPLQLAGGQLDVDRRRVLL